MPMALVKIRPRTLRFTQRSLIGPPIITPRKLDAAIVRVAIGPACVMSRARLSWKSVGSQFLVAQPGMELVAKKNRMTQKAMLPTTAAIDCKSGSRF